jgi:hypothetical protein
MYHSETNISLNKLIGIHTDGTPSMAGKSIGVVALSALVREQCYIIHFYEGGGNIYP